MNEVLRCGVCWRNLNTAWGRYYHTVFSDGSLRCFADEEASYAHGHAVLDVPELRHAIREYMAHHDPNQTGVVHRVEVEPGV